MVPNDNLPSQALLRELLAYDPDTGAFTWRAAASFDNPHGGKIAGHVRKDGRRFIGVSGFPSLGAHRLAWVYSHGTIPPGFEVDHKDRDHANDRLSNLRLATSSEQKRNRGVQTNNRSGIKGVAWHEAKGRWRSQIGIGRKPDGRAHYKFLGYFDDPEAAGAAYRQAELEHFGEFAHQARR